ncbi:MAG TPA: hypothetical protein VJX67_07360 [Blastocatellia bacterium]|nr:hypothetical protein [Blastocatellia bacterium]
MKVVPGRYFVEVERWGEEMFRCRLHAGDFIALRSAEGAKLGERALVRINRQTLRLGDLIDRLAQDPPRALSDLMDERGQRELGNYLHDQLFANGASPPLITSNDGAVDMRIIASDEHILRLPWMLLANSSGFLSARGWAVSFAAQAEYGRCSLPEAPRILVAMPQPKGVSSTGGPAHLKELEPIFNQRSRSISSKGHNLQVVTTWENFRTMIFNYRPEIIYLYGHGLGGLSSSRLLFASSDERALEVTIADVADCIRAARLCPKLIYLNCCKGDAGGLLGAGHQLRDLSPAVITNFTSADINAAKAQGLSLFRSILLDGHPPHEAMRRIRTDLGGMNLSLGDMRWIAPVLHCSYSEWDGKPPTLPTPDRDLSWRFSLDRSSQYGEVSHKVREMLKRSRPKSLAYIWYGREGEGVEVFHQRLKEDLQQEIWSVSEGAALIQYQPDWPLEFDNPQRSFHDMITQAFGVTALDEIPAVVRKKAYRGPGQLTLVYVRHMAKHESKLLTPEMLRLYLEWWDQHLVKRLDAYSFWLLGIAIEVDQPPRFLEEVEKALAGIELDSTSHTVLDEMDKLAERDLQNFLVENVTKLSTSREKELIRRIIRKTGGKYEMTLREIEKVIREMDRGYLDEDGEKQR